jgi:hypothetical protein
MSASPFITNTVAGDVSSADEVFPGKTGIMRRYVPLPGDGRLGLRIPAGCRRDRGGDQPERIGLPRPCVIMKVDEFH